MSIEIGFPNSLDKIVFLNLRTPIFSTLEVLIGTDKSYFFITSDNSFNFDGINYAVLGSKSEETAYRKSFYACDAGWITDANITTSNINSRGSGNFEETCSVIGEINSFYTFFFTDCNEICVEVNFALHNQNYNISENDFATLSDQIFGAIRNTVNGEGSADFNKILSNYKS